MDDVVPKPTEIAEDGMLHVPRLTCMHCGQVHAEVVFPGGVETDDPLMGECLAGRSAVPADHFG